MKYCREQMINWLRGSAVLAWLIILDAMLAPALGQSAPNYTLGPDPNQAAGPNMHGTRLAAGEAIVIQAPVKAALPGNPGQANGICTDPATGANICTCYSIINETTLNGQPGVSYFVPWRTPGEWSSFLAAIGAPYQLSHAPYTGPWPAPGGWVNARIGAGCCQPETVTQTTANLRCPITSPAQVGYRYLGLTTAADIPYWGAEGDVYVANEAAITGNSTVDYQVTLVCSNGAWVPTHEEGNCAPTNGQCAVGSNGITSLPPDCTGAATYCTSLCDPTSVFGGFTNPGGSGSPGPWTWTCLGTPGMANTACSSSLAVDGACGSADGQPTLWPSATLCANGTIASAATWSGGNTWNNSGTTYVPAGYQWTCSGINGSTMTASCSAPYAYGWCANWWDPGGTNGATWGTPPDPAADLTCAVGTPSAITYGQFSYWPDQVYTTNVGWTWTCDGPLGADPNGGFCFVTDANAVQPGTCGEDTVNTFATSPPANALCNPGSTATSVPTLIAGAPSYWQWTCRGNNGGSTVSCKATFNSTAGVCGPANNTGFATPPSDSAQLCSNGTPTGAGKTSDGKWWIWSCISGFGNSTICVGWVSSGSSGAQCGNANGIATPAAPVALCNAGNASAVSSDGSTWSWQCTDSSGNTASCSAPVGTTASTGACGAANGSPSPSVPSANLCAVGSPTAVLDNGAGQWVWTCQSTGGSMSCAAPNTATGPGSCGAANNTAIPNPPNQNLCASGVSGPVSGTGPWTWQCLGQGPDTGQNANCSANLCDACSGGTSTQNITLPWGSGTMNGCAVQAQISWTETDGVDANSAAVRLQWNDPFDGAFTRSISPSTAPTNYCRPCYLRMQRVTNAQVAVKPASGSCSGLPATYPATNVSVTP